MKKIRIFGVILALSLVVALIITSCGPKEAPPPPVPPPPPPTAPPTTPPPAPPPPPTWEATSWDHADPMAESYEGWRGSALKFSEELGRLSDGAVTITPHHGGSLLGWNDMALGIATRLTDIGYLNAANFPAWFPSMKIGGMIDPLVSLKQDGEHWGRINEIILQEIIREEILSKRIYPLYCIGGVDQLFFTTTLIDELEDFQGMKLRTYGGEFQAIFYEAIGAVGVPLSFGDYPEALERGIVGGNFSVLAPWVEAEMVGRTPYWLVGQEGSTLFSTAFMSGGYVHTINQDLWDSLSDDQKLDVLKAAKFGNEFVITHWVEENEPYVEEILAMGGIFTVLPEEDIERMMQHPVLATQWENLAKDIDAAGGRGTELIARMFELADMSEAEIEAIWEQLWAERLANLW